MQPSSGRVHRYPQRGEVIDGKYRIERLLAEGGMGAVAKATHLLRRAPVALKFMSAGARNHPGADERFVNEAVAASRIDSDHVVKIFDVARLPGGAPYLVMEFLEGYDLGTLLDRDGPKLETARAIHLALQILRALQMAHGVGIIHRDMKPSNCFVVDKEGERDFVKVVDFGLSKIRVFEDDAGARSSLTGTNIIFGTPHYMSPEQARSSRDVDLRTDLYSVGAVLYEMLSGRTPYTTDGGDNILYQVFMAEPDSLKAHCPDLPDALADAVHRALHREPEARFGSALEMAQALTPFADPRSGQVVARLLGSHGHSPVPARSGSIRPVDSDARAEPYEAMAKTLAGGHAPASANPHPSRVTSASPGSPSVTSPGSAREARDPPALVRTKGARRVAAIAAGALGLAIAGTGLFAARRSDRKADSTSVPNASAPHELGDTPAPPTSVPAEELAQGPGFPDASPPSFASGIASPSGPTSARSPSTAITTTVIAIPSSRVRRTGLEENFQR
jgi:serine/threonine protein kinase